MPDYRLVSQFACAAGEWDYMWTNQDGQIVERRTWETGDEIRVAALHKGRR